MTDLTDKQAGCGKGRRRKIIRPRRIKNDMDGGNPVSSGECATHTGMNICNAAAAAAAAASATNDRTEPDGMHLMVSLAKTDTNGDVHHLDVTSDEPDHQAVNAAIREPKKVSCNVCNQLFTERSMSRHVLLSHVDVPKRILRSNSSSAPTRHDVQTCLLDDSGDESNGSDEPSSKNGKLRNGRAKNSSDDDDDYEPVAKQRAKYECHVCFEWFSKLAMMAHMRTHTAKSYTCHLCGQDFQKEDMTAHMLTHRRCRGATSRKTEKKKRKQKNQATGQREEDDSSVAQSTTDAVSAGEAEVSSISSSRPLKVPCDVCGGLYRKSYLADHRRSHTGEKPFTCEECGRQFTSADGLRVHTRNRHDRGAREKVECSVCGRMLCSKVSLEQHLLTHSTVRSYQCEICGKAFKQPSALRNHVKTHDEGMPYQCEECGHRYKCVQGLILHRRHHHEGVSFPCELCPKVFTRRSKLKDHVMWHRGSSPYKCQYCGKLMLSRNTLNKHVLIHEGKKPYGCEVCGKAFRQNCVLKRHMSIHTGTKPFRCEQCGKQFIHRVYLKKHLCEFQDGSRSLLSL